VTGFAGRRWNEVHRGLPRRPSRHVERPLAGAGWTSGAKLVKAFNTVGFNIMANPEFGPSRPLMFYLR
jgi:hypothetical protein